MYFLKYITLFLSAIATVVNSCKVLSLSGGGSFGAYEMGIVATLIENGRGDWDVITGVSAGSINSAYLSTVNNTEEIKNIPEFRSLWFSTTNEKVYTKKYFLNGLSMYDTEPLKNTLTEIFKDRKPVRPVILSATSLVKGKSQLFDNKDIEKNGFVDIIMSSTAIPIYFPPYKFNNDIYVDGGLTSNVLIYEGIDYCLKNFPNESINIEVVVCGDKLGIDYDVINNFSFITVVKRLISILMQQTEYYEILSRILIEKPIVNITIYEIKNGMPVSFTDFDKSEYLWNQGYNFTNVRSYNKIINV